MQRLDREKYGALCASSREFISLAHNDALKHPGKNIIGNTDFVPEMGYLYEAMYRCPEKVLVLSPKTEKKIEQMNIDSLLKSPYALDTLFNGEDFGVVISSKNAIPPGDNLNAAYYYKEGRFYLHLWSSEYKIGYMVFDVEQEGGMQIYPHSIFGMLKMNIFPVDGEEKVAAQYAYDLLMKDYPDGIPDPLSMIKRDRYKKKTASASLFEMYKVDYDALLWIFKCFVFLRTSEVYSKVYVPDPTPTFRRKKGYRPLNYTYVDSTWDMNIDVNNPFPVRGHFVNQACKINGEWGHKLIYVEQYMKTGYHRRAKKTIIENEK